MKYLILVPDGMAADYTGNAAPQSEEIVSVEGQMGVYAAEFVRAGAFDTFGIRITLR